MKIFLISLILLPSIVFAADKNHYYSFNKGFEYGYEVEGSNELLVIKYLGKKNNLYQVMTTDGNSENTILECSRDCKYLTSYKYWKKKYDSESILIMKPNMVAWQMMQDASSGQLKQLTENGATLWINGRDGAEWSDIKKKQ